MSKADRTVETLITEMFGLISTAQRNGMSGHDAIVCGTRPFLERLLKLEAGESQVIQERDDAEEALSQAYYLVTGRSPEWSNIFGNKEALEEINDTQRMLREVAKPSLKAARQEFTHGLSPAQLRVMAEETASRQNEVELLDMADALEAGRCPECRSGVGAHRVECSRNACQCRSCKQEKSAKPAPRSVWPMERKDKNA